MNYYKFVNGEWIDCPNGIILPNTTEPTFDAEILQAEGWVLMDEKPVIEE